MTLSAGFPPQDNLPAPFSLGRLFGFRKDNEPAWRYEPPSSQPISEPLDLPTEFKSLSAHHLEPEPTKPTAFTSDNYRADASYSFAQNVPYPPDRANNIVTKETSAQEETRLKPDQAGVTVAHPMACFEDFKARITHTKGLSEGDRGRFLIEAFRACRPDHEKAWVYNVAVIEHLTELNWNPVRILAKLKQFALPPIYTAKCARLLGCLQKLSVSFPHSSGAYSRVQARLVEAAASAKASTRPEHDLNLLCLIQQSLQSACSSSAVGEQCVSKTLAVAASKIKNHLTRDALCSILEDSNTAESRIMLLLGNAPQHDSHRVALKQILSCLPKQHLRSLVPSVTLDLVKAAEWRSRLPQSVYKDRLSVWFTVLQDLDAELESTVNSATYLDTAVAHVAKYVFSNWNWSDVRPQVLLHALVFKFLQQERTPASTKERLLEIIYSSDTSGIGHQGQINCGTTLGAMLSRIQQESLPCAPLTSLLVDLFVRHANLEFVQRLLSALNQRGFKLDVTWDVRNLVLQKLAKLQQQSKALHTQQRQHYAFTLRTCQKLVDVLEEISTSTTTSFDRTKDTIFVLQAQRQFQEILDRANEAKALPHAYRKTTVNTSEEQRTVLIHQLAHHYSLGNTWSHRRTWRAIFYLHNYLKANNLPIGPLFTKAIVRISITRPLIEHRFISAARLIWVCHLVAQVEGVDAAKKIESLFWHWRGAVLKDAKAAHLDVGGDRKDRTLIKHMKKLGFT